VDDRTDAVDLDGFERRVDALLRRVTRLARTLVGTHQGAVMLTIGHDWQKARKYFSLSSTYARWRDFAVPAVGVGTHAVVLEQGVAVRMTQAELERDPRWRNFSGLDHPPMRGWLAVPLQGEDGRTYGLLQLSDKVDGSDFTDDDQHALTELAALVSSALDGWARALLRWDPAQEPVVRLTSALRTDVAEAVPADD
jgi:GAF domain-containing protein